VWPITSMGMCSCATGARPQPTPRVHYSANANLDSVNPATRTQKDCLWVERTAYAAKILRLRQPPKSGDTIPDVPSRQVRDEHHSRCVRSLRSPSAEYPHATSLMGIACRYWRADRPGRAGDHDGQAVELHHGLGHDPRARRRGTLRRGDAAWRSRHRIIVADSPHPHP
jgi:hypothetical protein